MENICLQLAKNSSWCVLVGIEWPSEGHLMTVGCACPSEWHLNLTKS